MHKAGLVRQMFERISKRYDLLNILMSGGLDNQWRRRAVRLLQLKPGEQALDLCCGTGVLASMLARRVGAENVLGLDFSGSMLKVAKRKFPGIAFKEADALDTGLPGNSYAAVTNAFALRNVDSVKALIGEMKRLAQPGGRILSLELTRPSGVLGFLHRWYIRLSLPLLGWLLSGEIGPYQYLARSVLNFPPPGQVADLMQRAGLADVRVIPCSWGIATICVGTKPLE